MSARRKLFGAMGASAASNMDAIPARQCELATVQWFNREEMIGFAKCDGNGRIVKMDYTCASDRLRAAQKVWVTWVQLPDSSFTATQVRTA